MNPTGFISDRRASPRESTQPGARDGGPPAGRPADSTKEDAVVVVDNDLRVTYWGPGAVELYRLPVEEAVGRRLEELYEIRWTHPEDERIAHRALASHGVASGRNLHVLRSGEEVRVEWQVIVLREDDGGMRGLAAAIRPIVSGRSGEGSETRAGAEARGIPAAR